MFLCITIIMLPVLALYSKNHNQGVKGLETVSWKTNLNIFSLGNMGGASTQCVTTRLQVDTDETDKSIAAYLTCPNGAIASIANDKSSTHKGDKYKFGVMAKGVDERNYC